MSNRHDSRNKLFDKWPDRYDDWFQTPIGSLVKRYECALLIELSQPQQGGNILDVGCGTGIFTVEILSRGPGIVGLELSRPMITRALKRVTGYPFLPVIGNMMSLPFSDGVFDKTVSMTALEFAADAAAAIAELFRVTRRGGTVVVTTLNSLSPWATRRIRKADSGHRLFQKMFFRSPNDMRAVAPVDGIMKTAIHFAKDTDPENAPEIEKEGQALELNTGAFLAARWVKP